MSKAEVSARKKRASPAGEVEEQSQCQLTRADSKPLSCHTSNTEAATPKPEAVREAFVP